MKHVHAALPVFIALALLAATPAQAQKAKAKRLFDQGVAALEEFKYKEALEAFSGAYKAAPHWAVLGHIGNCHSRLNQPVEAIEAYERYLRDGGDDVPAVERESALKALEEQRRKVGTLILLVRPSDALVKINGEPIGNPPFGEIMLRAGPHQIMAIRDGVEETRDISIYSGKELTVRMYPEDTPVAIAPSAPDPARDDPVEDIEPDVHVEPEPEPEPLEAVLAVNANVDGAGVEIDGEDMGEVPYEGTLLAGPIHLGVSADGFVPYSASLTLQGDMRTGVLVDLVDEGEQPERLSVPFWIAAGVGAVGLVGAGVGWGLFAYNKNSEANYADVIAGMPYEYADCFGEECCTSEQHYYCNTEWNRRDYEDRAKVSMAIAIPSTVLFAAGGTMAALFYFKPEWFFGARSSAEITISPIATGDQNGLLLGGRF